MSGQKGVVWNISRGPVCSTLGICEGRGEGGFDVFLLITLLSPMMTELVN